MSVQLVNKYSSLFKYKSEDYQLEGTSEVVDKNMFFIADKPGSGKSKQVIDAACILYMQRQIDTVVVCCPAQVKISWFDEDFGEIVKHCWVPSLVCEFSSKRPIIPHSPDELIWVVVSYEFGRADLYERMLSGELKGRKTMFICDESIYLANWKSKQHGVFKTLVHQRADRVVIMNGTPGDPIDLYGQFEVMSPAIIGCKNYYHFEHRYCDKAPIYPGSNIKKVVEFVNRDLLDDRIKPYILRREPQLNVARVDQIISVPLLPRNWTLYKQMRDSLIVWLGAKQATAANAMVKGIRLAQITSGILGGIKDDPFSLFGGDSLPADDFGDYPDLDNYEGVQITGSEKLDGTLDWIRDRERETPSLRLLIWCRFRPEIRRLRSAIEAKGYITGAVVGGQPRKEREAAVREFTTGDPSKPYIIVGQQQAGGMGLNLITCHRTLYVSNSYSWRYREQTELRTLRKGQTHDCIFTDMLATGPEGQKTIDHHIVKSLRNQESIASWTMEDWRRKLADE